MNLLKIYLLIFSFVLTSCAHFPHSQVDGELPIKLNRDIFEAIAARTCKNKILNSSLAIETIYERFLSDESYNEIKVMMQIMPESSEIAKKTLVSKYLDEKSEIISGSNYFSSFFYRELDTYDSEKGLLVLFKGPFLFENEWYSGEKRKARMFMIEPTVNSSPIYKDSKKGLGVSYPADEAYAMLKEERALYGRFYYGDPKCNLKFDAKTMFSVGRMVVKLDFRPIMVELYDDKKIIKAWR